MFFQTKSGSRYEIDTAKKKIRRLSSKAFAAGAPIQEGEWMDYKCGYLPEVGSRVALDMTDGKSLITTVVTKIEE